MPQESQKAPPGPAQRSEDARGPLGPPLTAPVKADARQRVSQPGFDQSSTSSPASKVRPGAEPVAGIARDECHSYSNGVYVRPAILDILALTLISGGSQEPVCDRDPEESANRLTGADSQP